MRAGKAAYDPSARAAKLPKAAPQSDEGASNGHYAHFSSQRVLFLYTEGGNHLSHRKPVLRPSAEGRAALPSFGLPLERRDTVEHYFLPI